MFEQAGLDFGRAISSVEIETGLRELNRDINFDIAVRKPDEAFYTLTTDFQRRSAIEKGRLPVCHGDRYICSMDRGLVPEFKVWNVQEIPVEVDWSDADKEQASISYQTIPPTDPSYLDLRSDAIRGANNGLKILDDGRLAKVKCIAMRKVRGRVFKVGWRFTFTRLIDANIVGVTRDSISQKFNIDMRKYPMGPPEDVMAALMEE